MIPIFSLVDLFFERFHPLEQLAEPAHPGELLRRFLQRHRWTRPPRPPVQTFRDAGLRPNHRSVVDLDMPDDPGLTANHHTGTDPHASGDSDLGHDDRMFPDYDVVRDLHQIIDLRSFLDPGSAKPGSIDRRVRADLNIIVDLHDADLRDFLVPARFHLEAETVGTDHHPAVKNDAVSDPATLADRDIGVDNAVVANRRLVSDIAVCPNPRPRSDRRAGLDHSMGPKCDLFA